MIFRILTIYHVLGSRPELMDADASASPDLPSLYVRFGTEHYDIVNKLLLSCGTWRTRLDLFRLAQEAFEREHLPSMSFDSFRTHMRRIMMNVKVGKEYSGKLRSHMFTPQHMGLLEELVMEHPHCSSDTLFPVLNQRFKNIGLRPMTEGLFKLRVRHIRRLNKLPSGSSHLCTLQEEPKSKKNVNVFRSYTGKHKEIIKELVKAHPSESGRKIFELASKKFAEERIDQLKFEAFSPRFTIIRAALRLKDSSITPKIGREASNFLSKVYHDNSKLTPVVAWKTLRDSGKVTPALLPSKKSVKYWLKYRQKIAGVSKDNNESS